MKRRTAEELNAKLAHLKVYADTFSKAEAIAERYHRNRSGLHGLLQANACAWECSSCHRVVETPRAFPPRGACRNCGTEDWVRLVPEAPPPKTMPAPQVTAQDFTMDLEIWIGGWWGQEAVDLVLCEGYSDEDRDRCRLRCDRCPEQLRIAMRVKVREAYDRKPARAASDGGLDNGIERTYIADRGAEVCEGTSPHRRPP